MALGSKVELADFEARITAVGGYKRPAPGVPGTRTVSVLSDALSVVPLQGKKTKALRDDVAGRWPGLLRSQTFQTRPTCDHLSLD